MGYGMHLTGAVIRSFSDTPNPRLKRVLQQLVTSLHDFVRKSDLTFDEWEQAIEFLTRTGQKCTGSRQEFILLSDVLGVSMLVDAINHSNRGGATETTVLGPFYVGEHMVRPSGTDIAESCKGEPMFVDVRILDEDGAPIVGAKVDVWHADDDGLYDSQKSSYLANGASLRARFLSDAEGRITFRTILPCSYPIPTDGPVGELLLATGRHPMRPAHIHFLVAAASFEPLITHLFIEGDQYLQSDAVFGVKRELVSKVEKRTERAMPDGRVAEAPWYVLHYDFHLKKGEGSPPKPLGIS